MLETQQEQLNIALSIRKLLSVSLVVVSVQTILKKLCFKLCWFLRKKKKKFRYYHVPFYLVNSRQEHVSGTTLAGTNVLQIFF